MKINKFIILTIIIIVLSISTYYLIKEESFEIRDKAASMDEWGDGRFGIGGEFWQQLTSYKIKWVYNWGWDVVGNHLFENGRENMILIGDPNYPKDICSSDGIIQNPPNCGGFKLICDLAKKYPNSYWSIDNEPDWQGYMTPDKFARSYNAFYNEIKRCDKNAYISIGGLAWPKYNHPSKWANKDLVNDPYIISLINSNPANRDLYENTAWLTLFRKYYKDYFGTFPIVDFWNIHAYPWAGASSEERFNDSKQEVEFFRKYMNFIGDAYKPLWVTEFSWMGSKCTTYEDCNSKSTYQIEYMTKMIEWLVSNKNAQKWFWYYGGEEIKWSDSNYTADIFYKSNELNLVGQKYLELARKYKDVQKPMINSLTILEQTDNNIKINIESSDDNSGIVEYLYSIGTKHDNNDIKNWEKITDIRTVYVMNIKNPPLQYDSYYINIKVNDASGNESDVKSVNIRKSNNIQADPLKDLAPKGSPDGKINILDLTMVLSNWKWKKEPKDNETDVNKDGKVDMLDVSLIINNWTKKY